SDGNVTCDAIEEREARRPRLSNVSGDGSGIQSNGRVLQPKVAKEVNPGPERWRGMPFPTRGPGHVESPARRGLGQLFDQARLADARDAADNRQAATPLRDRCRQRR